MSPSTSPSIVVSALGLVLVYGRPILARYRWDSTADPDWSTIRRLLVENWAVVGVVALAVAAVDGPAALGYRALPVEGVVDGVLYGFVAFAGTMLLVGLALRLFDGVTADAGSLVVLDQPVERRLAVAVTGAVAESLLFYGFALETLLAFGSGPWLAGTAATAGLLLSRARWGPRNALQWLPGAIVLAAVALVARSVVVVVLVRLLYDCLTLASSDADDYEGPVDVT